jgi:hypothetical protein
MGFKYLSQIIDDAAKFDENFRTEENLIADLLEPGILKVVVLRYCSVIRVPWFYFQDENADLTRIAQIEQEFLLEMKKFDENQMKADAIRRAEEEARRKQIEIEQQQSESKWKQIQEKLQFEKDQLESEKRKIDEEHSRRMNEQQKCIDRNLEILKVNLDQFTFQFESENQNLNRLNTEYKSNEQKRKAKAATLIQKHYRGYRFVGLRRGVVQSQPISPGLFSVQESENAMAKNSSFE